ncbi:MAG: ComF family protein [Candidatus Omnitrophota bacterium]
MGLLRNLISGLCDIVYPKTCHACGLKITAGSIDGLVCASCWSKIKRNLPPFCRKCGRNIAGSGSGNNSCANCVSGNLHFDRAFSPCLYDGTIKELVHAFKYKNKDYLSGILARPMIEFIEEYNLPMRAIDALAAVPLSTVKLREREFNQALLLAGHIGKEFNKEILHGRLLRLRNTRSQAELDNRQRCLNVMDAFSVSKGPDLNGKNILLIDDVLTTGATASEAAKALKNAGANMVYVLTLAS